jgi:ribosomal protein L13
VLQALSQSAQSGATLRQPNHFIERAVSGMLRMPPTSAHGDR